ncbi:MAG: FAD-binding protein, partial [Gammaproteobacteria bacterium]|nr:FAD-binding protein [Gammaproteobacteria bacterium]
MNEIDRTRRRNDLAAKLRPMVSGHHVLSSNEELAPYECDGLAAYRVVPLLVVLPGSVEEVQEVLRICHAEGVAVVARGAGTGLSGGALPHEDGILLSLARLNRILSIDPDNGCARVQPGVRNLAISEAAKPHGLYYAPDPSSQIACTIGGNVAENAGGVHCLKYGLTVNNLLAVEIVTIEGERLTLGGGGLDGPGYDLLALITGSEGMLGVVVEVTVKLLPIPQRAQVALAAFDDVEAAGQAVADIIAAGILPAGLEMMDNPSIRAAEDFVHAGYPTQAAAILLCEVDGGNEEVSEDIARVRQRLLDSGASEVRTASDDAERARFWAGRKAAFPAVGRISPDYYCMDGTIPRKHLPHVLREIARYSKESGLRVANVFHAGDGNLHPNILFDPADSAMMARVLEAGEVILKACLGVGGVLSGEHGIGLEKAHFMDQLFGPVELEVMKRLKRVFDPMGLANPAKIFPAGGGCGEGRHSNREAVKAGLPLKQLNA